MKNKKINAFDVAAIIVIIAAISGLVLYFRSTSSSKDIELGDKVTYVLEVGSTTQDTADAISIGDELFDITTKNALGTVTDKEILQAVDLTLNYETGEYIITPIPERVKVLITVEAPITESATAIRVDGVQMIKVSYSFSVQGSGYTVTASVTNILRGEN